MSEHDEAVPGEDLVIHAPAAAASAGTDSGINPEQESGDGVD